MKTIRLGCTDIGAILFAGLDDDNHLCGAYISVGGDGEFTGLLTTNKAEIPYGGYMHTMFNNTLLQLVNYTNCEKLWQIAFINNGQLGIFNG